MTSLTIAGVAFGIIAAVSAGVGGFLGGVASRRSTAWGTATVSWLAQAPLLVGLVYLLESGLDGTAVLPGVVAGLAGAVGMVFLYSGIARGDIATVAATSGVVASVCVAMYDYVTGCCPSGCGVGGDRVGPPRDRPGCRWMRPSRSRLRASIGQGVGGGRLFRSALRIDGVYERSERESEHDHGGGYRGRTAIASVPTALSGSDHAERTGPRVLRGGRAAGRYALGGSAFRSQARVDCHRDRARLPIPAFTVLTAALAWGRRPTRLQVVGLIMALVSVGTLAWGAS